jgi:hypothetical protein
MLAVGSVSSIGLLGGGHPMLLLSPEHATIIAREKSRASAQAYLFESARLPISAIPQRTRDNLGQHGIDPPRDGEERNLAAGACAGDIMLVVVGGVGYKSTFVPSWGGGSVAITKPIAEAAQST